MTTPTGTRKSPYAAVEVSYSSADNLQICSNICEGKIHHAHPSLEGLLYWVTQNPDNNSFVQMVGAVDRCRRSIQERMWGSLDPYSKIEADADKQSLDFLLKIFSKRNVKSVNGAASCDS